MPFAFGDVVVYRDVLNGRITGETPARVVEDSDERVVLWWPVGTVGRVLDDHGDRLSFFRIRASAEPFELTPRTWHTTDVLAIIPWSAPYALWVFRDEAGKHIGWYCNLQAPLARAADGFETCDWALDVWAGDDLSYWIYKDEDEVALLLDEGVFDAPFVEEVRAAGRAVVELIERRDSIFDRWPAWTPPADWTTPILP